MAFRRSLLLGAMFTCATACGGTPGSTDGVENTQDPIISPTQTDTLVSAATQQSLGLVYVNGGGCSGVLIANDWVMTAGHCVSQVGVGNSTSMSAGFSAANEIASDAVYLFGSVNLGINPDLAIFHLSSPLAVNGSTTGFSNVIDTTPSASLGVGTAVTEYGQGCFTEQSGFFMAQCDHAWRSASYGVGSTSRGFVTVTPNSIGQIAASGDSGGPYFRSVNGAQRIVSIQSTDQGTCQGTPTPPSCPSVNLGPITSSTSIDLGDYNNWIAAVFQSQWDSTRPVQWVDVLSGEIAGLAAEPGHGVPTNFTELNTVAWYNTGAVAAWACFNRGFSGNGHFIGHESSPRYGVLCEGAGSTGRNVSQATINATPEPFVNNHTIGWAKANRDAGFVCHDMLGFVSGYFDGTQDLSTGTYGIICNQTNATYFLATAADLANTGWPVGDVDQVGWAQAGRAATGYCTARGFVAGYLNGQENRTNGTYGVICQG